MSYKFNASMVYVMKGGCGYVFLKEKISNFHNRFSMRLMGFTSFDTLFIRLPKLIYYETGTVYDQRLW